MKKPLHYSDLAFMIRDFILNNKVSVLNIEGEIWNENDESRLFQVEIKKGDCKVSATFSDESGVWPMGEWWHDDKQCRHHLTYDRIYNWVANKLQKEWNWYFAKPEHNNLQAKRGDHAGGWYQIGDRCVELNHSDWCVFDDKGNVGCSWEGRPYVWSTKKVAQEFADNPGRMFDRWAMPIQNPLANMIQKN